MPIHRFQIEYKTDDNIDMLYGTDSRHEALDFLRILYKAKLELAGHNLTSANLLCGKDCPKISKPESKKCTIHGEEVTCYCEEKKSKEKVFEVTI